jgi:hypothetical protein
MAWASCPEAPVTRTFMANQCKKGQQLKEEGKKPPMNTDEHR